MRAQEDDIAPEPGYERVEIGPTTNIVGNHMTQAAIDLVQAELEPPSDALQHDDCAINPPPPKCIDRQTARVEKEAKSIQRYGWYDCGGHIKVEISLEKGIKEAQCTNTSQSVNVSVTTSEGEVYVLCLRPLAAEIKDDSSACCIRGHKVFVTFQKLNCVAWKRLCREERHSTPRLGATDDLRRLEMARQQLTRTNSTEPCHSQISQRPTFATPLNKVTAQLREEELEIVHKLTQEGIQRVRLGDYCSALHMFSAASEDILRLATKQPQKHDSSPLPEVQGIPGEFSFVPSVRLFLAAADLHHRLAKCSLQLGRLKDAIHLCTSSLAEIQTSRSEMDDLIVEVLFTRATASESLERYEEAQRDFKEILVHRRDRRAADGMRRVQRLQLAQNRSGR